MQDSDFDDLSTTRMTEISTIAGSVDANAPADTREASLVVLAGWEIGKEIKVTQTPMIVGRAAQAEICINAPSISRNHAKIEWVEAGAEGAHFQITDLASSNGTRVNNVRVTTKELQNGDKIHMGDVLFKFVLQDAVEAQFHQDVHRLIHYDQLTGLLTREAFRQRLDALLRITPKEQRMTLAMTDLDGLKRVNDRHGHLMGSRIIREMGGVVRECMREQDVAGIYGGDECMLLFPATALDGGRAQSEILRQRIQEHIFSEEHADVRVTISIGLAEWPTHGDAAVPLLAAADRALYAAKAAGRNCIRGVDDLDTV
ncbi:MAG: diguanylate cyclase [Candidatus Hydrogenedentes bacterium]|nr:diguanylate cyclase [Candidatus Hydrogenedentota bacterium]